MSLVTLPDREEGTLNGEWFLREIITISCPVCGTWTDIVITGPTNTNFVHELGPKGSQCFILNQQLPNFLAERITLDQQRFSRSFYLDPWNRAGGHIDDMAGPYEEE